MTIGRVVLQYQRCQAAVATEYTTGPTIANRRRGSSQPCRNQVKLWVAMAAQKTVCVVASAAMIPIAGAHSIVRRSSGTGAIPRLLYMPRNEGNKPGLFALTAGTRLC